MRLSGLSSPAAAFVLAAFYATTARDYSASSLMGGARLPTWDLALDSARASFARRLARRHQDPRVKVILVTFRSPFDV